MDKPYGLTNIALYGDDPSRLQRLHYKAESAQLNVSATGNLTDLAHVDLPADTLLLVDLHRADDAVGQSALDALDLQRRDGGVIVSLDLVDQACAVLDGTMIEILVDPHPAEVIFALHQIQARARALNVAELSNEDRLYLNRLGDQITTIAANIDALMQRSGGTTPYVATPAMDFGQRQEDFSGGLVDKNKPVPPDPRVVRQTIRNRRLRHRYFDPALFADPAWDILLDLFAARIEGQQVSVSSLCIAAAVPPTTALRWVRQMTDNGLCRRIDDSLDKRRAFIALGDQGYLAMCRYFADLRQQGEVKGGGVSA